MDWKKLCQKLLFPSIWLLILLTIVSAAALITVFVRGWDTAIIAYIVYVLSFYTLCVDCLFCWLVLPKQFSKIKQAVLANPIGHRYVTDREFRVNVSLSASLLINMLYVGANIWIWHSARSWWFIVLAGYYCIMAIMRFLLVRYVRLNNLGDHVIREWKHSRLCACILLLVNLSLSGAVLMMLYQNRGYDYPGILIYVMAMFTFYSVTHAILEAIRYRSFASPVMTASKVVSLSAALVSLLNLETAMFAQFGADMPQEDQNLMIILTGAGISITVVTLSVLLIVRSTQNLRREKNGT